MPLVNIYLLFYTASFLLPSPPLIVKKKKKMPFGELISLTFSWCSFYSHGWLWHQWLGIFRPGPSEHHFLKFQYFLKKGWAEDPVWAYQSQLWNFKKRHHSLYPWTWVCEYVNLELFNSLCPLTFMREKSISENGTKREENRS